jgi:molecular chaperone HtpG
LKAVGQDAPDMKPTLEVNLDHPLVKRLETETDATKFDDLGMILFDQAQLAEGGQLDDPAAFVGRLNKLMLNMFMAGG